MYMNFFVVSRVLVISLRALYFCFFIVAKFYGKITTIDILLSLGNFPSLSSSRDYWRRIEILGWFARFLLLHVQLSNHTHTQIHMQTTALTLLRSPSWPWTSTRQRWNSFLTCRWRCGGWTRDSLTTTLRSTMSLIRSHSTTFSISGPQRYAGCLFRYNRVNGVDSDGLEFSDSP